jgi:hypothetical protein
MKGIFKAAMGIELASILACAPVESGDNETGREVWMAMRPVNCMGNLWQQDWLAGNNYSSEGYPQDDTEIVRSYLSSQDIQVGGLFLKNLFEEGWQQPIECRTCDCQRGDILYVLVNGNDSEKMREMGFDYTGFLTREDMGF